MLCLHDTFEANFLRAHELIAGFDTENCCTIDYSSGAAPRFLQVPVKLLGGESGRIVRGRLASSLAPTIISLTGEPAQPTELSAEIVDWLMSFEKLSGLCLTDFTSFQALFEVSDLLSRLQELLLYSSHLSSQDTTAISRLGHLKILGLSGTRMPTTAATFIAPLKNLTILSISNSSVTRDLLPTLIGMTSLRYLELSPTQLTSREIEHLRSCLPHCYVDTGHSSVDCSC